MKKFYQLKKQNENETELYIYGDIKAYKYSESDVGSFDMAKDLADVTTPVTVRINSYGGDVAEGLAIHNLLKSNPNKVTTRCDGMACSAASVIFMAGTDRIMPKSSLLLIHNAWTCTCGDSNDLRKQADDLEKITQPSIEIYKSVSNLSEDEIKAMMDREEWITADEALAYGFATAIVDDEPEVKQSAKENLLQKAVFKVKELEKKLNETNIEPDAWTSFFNGGK